MVCLERSTCAYVCVIVKKKVGGMVVGETTIRSSVEGRTVDALARTGEEGRGKLRKASGRSTHPVIRRCPNGETRQPSLAVIPG
jgi:hypothetical protein